MDFGIFYEIQVNSPLKHREREAQAFYDTTDQVVRAEEMGFTQAPTRSSNSWSACRRKLPSISSSR